MNLIIGVTGSVATIKLKNLLEEFNKKHSEISLKIVCTNNALQFLKDSDIPDSCPIYTDEMEWNIWNKIGDPILHIELRNWADAILIAPLDANTMAKLANGICDNLLTCIIRAWDMKEKGSSVFLAPAMNTAMWMHPITEEQMEKLRKFGYKFIMPVEKKLACGDIGIGAMAHVDEIVDAILNIKVTK